jgi:transposase
MRRDHDRHPAPATPSALAARPQGAYVWDNLRIHSDPEVVQAIKAKGARLQFTPPYSPEFNPIEEAWSKMKAILRTAKARTGSELIEFLGDALRAISPADCLGWFRHAGYAVP